MPNSSLIWLLAGTLLTSSIIAWAAGFVVRLLAPRCGLLDQPGDDRKIHTAATPLGGGLAIGLGVAVSLLLGQWVVWYAAGGESPAPWLPELVTLHLGGLIEQSARLWLLLAAAGVMLLVGLIDDARGLDWRIRLAVQVIVATTVVLWQDWRLTAFIPIPAVTYALSVLWIVALVNAFNMLDNMDGLAAGVAAIAAGILAAVVLLPPYAEASGPQLFVGGFLLVLVGSLTGFLWHNRPPARLFMGDAGSYFIGFTLAAATLAGTYTRYGANTWYAVIAPLCVMAVPLYDMVTVLWIRIRAGRSPFQADRRHFSHRLVALGFSKTQAVLTIYLMTATCGLGALLLPRVDLPGAVVIVLMICCVLALVAILESTAAGRNDAS